MVLQKAPKRSLVWGYGSQEYIDKEVELTLLSNDGQHTSTYRTTVQYSKSTKGLFTKFNVARKRKFIAKGVGGGGSKAHLYFLHGPGDIEFKRIFTLKITIE